jgi:hypothetical protein
MVQRKGCPDAPAKPQNRLYCPDRRPEMAARTDASLFVAGPVSVALISQGIG